MADSEAARDALDTQRQWALGGVDFDVTNVEVDGEYIVVDFRVTGPLGQVWFDDRNRILRPRLWTHDGTFTTTNIYQNDNNGNIRYLTAAEFAALPAIVRNQFTQQPGTYERPNYVLAPRLAILRDLFHTARIVTQDWTVPHVMRHPDGTFGGDTLTVFATDDGYIRSQSNSTIGAARAGASLLATTTNPNQFSSNFTGGFYIFRWIGLAFDTSALGAGSTVSASALSLAGAGSALSNADSVTVEARYHDYGAGDPATGDWFDITTTGWTGKLLAHSRALAGWTTTADVYQAMTDAGNHSGVNLTGTTRMVIGTSLFGSGTPTGLNDLLTRASEATGTTSDPKLVITYSTGISHTAAAALSIVATVAAAPKRTAHGAAAVTSPLAVTPTAKLTAHALASLAMVVSMTAHALRPKPLAGSVAMAMALTAWPRRTRHPQATLAMVTTVTAAPHVTYGARANIAMVMSASGAPIGHYKARAALAMVVTLVADLDIFEIFIPPPRIRPRVFLHDGASLRRIAQIVNVVDLNRSFALREHVRQAQFAIPASDELAYLTDPMLANVILIESNEYPLPWVGRIIEREADLGARTITVHADSYDAILAERYLPADFTTGPGTTQAISRILGQINGQNPTGIGLDARMLTAGRSSPMALSSARGIEALDKLAENAGMEWWLSYLYDHGEISPFLNLATERGADYSSSVVLAQPGNYELQGWRENGRAIAYAQTVVGGAATVTQSFSERERAIAVRDAQTNRTDGSTSAHVVEAQRVLRFGHLLAGESSFLAPTQRRELLAVREELKEAGITPDVAEAMLTRWRTPLRSVIGRVYPDTRREPATSWKYLEPGNVVRLSSADAFATGYDGPAVIVGVQPMEHERFIDVVLEVA